MVKKVALLGFLLLIVASGCSSHWREVGTQLSPDEVISMLNEVASGQGSSFAGGNLSTALALKDDPATAIYFADAPGDLGPVGSILSFSSFEFLGLPDLWWGAISQARVFFLDLPADSGRQNALIIGLDRGDGNLAYYAFSGSSSIDGNEFVAELTGGGGQGRIILRSYDVSNEDLEAVIQLKVYDFDSSGNERYLGKFSTLVGYGP